MPGVLLQAKTYPPSPVSSPIPMCHGVVQFRFLGWSLGFRVWGLGLGFLVKGFRVRVGPSVVDGGLYILVM